MKRVALVVLLSVAIGLFTVARSSADGTYTGYISDHRCGTNIDAACNKQCFDQGETPVLVLDGSGDLVDLANADTMTSLPGAHVEIRGQMDAKTKTLTVTSVRRVS